MTAQKGGAERPRLVADVCEKTGEQGVVRSEKKNPSLKLVKTADNSFCTHRLFLNMRKLTAINCNFMFPLPIVITTIFLQCLKRKSGSRKQNDRQPHLYVRRFLCSMELSYIGKQSVSRFSFTNTLDFTHELLY